jgi:uncharacterized repeat protein (TIGR02543 family)
VATLGNTGSLTKTGFVFGGWTNSAGTLYQDGSTLTMGGANIQFYAKWLIAYSITYNGNNQTSGTVPTDSTSYTNGQTATAAGNTGSLTKTGFSFIGWTNSAGTHFQASSTLIISSASIILYAKWGYDFSSMQNIEMVSVPGGTFYQTDLQWSSGGSGFNHTISAFELGKYEVSYELWSTVRDWASNNGYNFNENFFYGGREGNDGTYSAAPTVAKLEPVTEVIWSDLLVWCNAYSEMKGYTPCYNDGGGNPIRSSHTTNASVIDAVVCDWSANGYRLPTYGEHRYAAAYQDGATFTAYNNVSGDTSGYCYPIDGGESTDYTNYAYYSSNSSGVSHVGGELQSNALGLYDMSGNIRERVWDQASSAINTYPGAGAQTDYRGDGTSTDRVYIGGYYGDLTSIDLMMGNARITGTSPANFNGIGFRIARYQ